MRAKLFGGKDSFVVSNIIPYIINYEEQKRHLQQRNPTDIPLIK